MRLCSICKYNLRLYITSSISFSKHCSNCYGHAKGEKTVVHVYLNLIAQNILMKCNQYTQYRYNMYMYCSQVYNQAPKMFPALLEMLTDECDEVSWKWVYVVITAHMVHVYIIVR